MADQENAKKSDLRAKVAKAWGFVRGLSKKEYSHLAACFLIPFGIMLLIYMVRGIHPLGNGTVLVLDLNGQYVYFYEALREFIYGDTSLLYSFSRALGGEFLGIYAYYLASPLSWLVALFPLGRIQEALLFIFLLKTGLCGVTFGWYLHKTVPDFNKTYVRIFSTMYALCSYAVVHQHNSMWIDALIWLPVLTFAIENLIKNGKYKLFIIALAVTVMSNYYIGYMVCFYVALYFFYYMAAHKDSNPRGESFHFIKSLGRIGVCSALALGISAVLILGAYYSLGFGKSTFSTADFSFFARFTLADLFVKFLPGAYDTVSPSGLPMLYCGTLTLILVPFYYMRHDISVREKLCSTLFIAVFVMSFIINPVDIVWHGFQKPNWLNYRYSFMLCFFLLVLAHKAMMGIHKQKSSIVFTIGTVLLMAVMILEKFEYKSFVLDEYGLEPGKLDPFRTVWFTIIMLVALCAILHLIIRAEDEEPRRRYSAILLIVVCAEIFANGLIQTTSLDIDVGYSTYSSYNSYTNTVREIAEKVQEFDDSFYRMEKTRSRKNNDNMALNMRGLSLSTSTLNSETIAFIKLMGYVGRSHRAKYMMGTPVNDSLLGIKYVLSEKKVSESRSDYHENRAIHAMLEELYTVAVETDDYVAFQNPYALSIAYCVSDDIKDFVFYDSYDERGYEAPRESSPIERLNSLVTALMGAEERIELFVPIELFTGCRDIYDEEDNTVTYYGRADEGDTAVTFLGEMPVDGYVFFYAPIDSSDEPKVYMNDLAFGDFSHASSRRGGTDSTRIKTLGQFSAGDAVELSLVIEDSALTVEADCNMLYYLDLDKFEEVMGVLASQQLEIESYTEDSFDGTITTAKENTSVLTTIPYDEGWKVYVDGQQVDVFNAANGLVAFEVAGVGEHDIEMVYRPQVVMLGAWVSLGSLLVFAGIVVLEYLLKRKNKKETAVELS